MPVTPRVPIQTPMFDKDGLLTRTWIIFFERLKEGGGAGEDLEKATFVIYDSAVGSNVTNLLPVPRAGTAVIAGCVPKQDVSTDFTFDILISRAGEAFSTRTSIFGTDKLTAPAGTLAGEVVEQATFVSDPFELEVEDILSADILESDGTGIYTVVLAWSING